MEMLHQEASTRSKKKKFLLQNLQSGAENLAVGGSFEYNKTRGISKLIFFFVSPDADRLQSQDASILYSHS